MRLYHFLRADHALGDLRRKGRLKIAEIDNLNDPFELFCSSQRDHRIRTALRGWKREITKAYGLLCFCAQWHNPLLWSHYADRHRGICLGFDVRDNLPKEIRYLRTRTTLRLARSAPLRSRISSIR